MLPLCAIMLPILGFCIFGLGFLFIYRNACQAMENTILPMLSGFLEVAMRLGVGLLIERQSLRGVAFAEVSAWIAAVVMLQRILGAFLLCVPISFLMSRQSSVSLFCVGSAMPVTSLLQIIQSLI